VDELSTLVRWATDGLQPDLNVLVDVPIEIARQRLTGVAPDRLERLGADFHQRVRDGFLAQAGADPDHWLVVDGTAGTEEVASGITAGLEARLGPAGLSRR
jgi:dTMP kinase